MDIKDTNTYSLKRGTTGNLGAANAKVSGLATNDSSAKNFSEGTGAPAEKKPTSSLVTPPRSET